MATVDAPTVSKLPLYVMGAVVGLAILVTIALVVARGPADYEPGTPEAALQDFLDAAFDEDGDALLALMSPEPRERCRDHFEDYGYGRYSSDGLRLELERMDVSGDTATAQVELHQAADNPFDNSRWSYTESFELTRIDGEWLIEHAGWPWQAADCTWERR